MEHLPIKYLKQLKTISAVKVLVALLSKHKDNEVELSINDLVDASSISKNSVRNAIDELTELGIIKVIENGRGSKTSRYELFGGSEIEGPRVDIPKVAIPKVDPPEWKKSTGARKSNKEEDSNIINNINNKDLNNIVLLKEDINSLMVLNSNVYMNDAELGKLANRVVREVFLPVTTGTKANYWYPQQMKLMKDLLVEWRTEQVIAAIQYWGKINPPQSGITSLRFLTFKRKNTSNIMHALDYYKQQYLANAHEQEREKAEEKIAEMALKAEQEALKEQAEREKVDSMSDADFLKKMLGG